MYRDTVNDVVKAKVEEATGAKGIKLLKFNDYSPILGELYKPTTVQLPRKPARCLTCHVTARRTIDRAVPPVGSARTRLAGV
jgi:hypothetical protein